MKTHKKTSLSSLERLLMAKANNIGEWLPLLVHLQDTAGIMKHLLGEYLSNGFCKRCGLNYQELEGVCLFLAYIHDIGKACSVFLSKISIAIPFAGQRLSKYGLIIPTIDYYDKPEVTPHSLAGENILLYYGCPKGVSAVVGAHHGIPTEQMELDNQLISLGKQQAYRENYYSQNERNLWIDIWDEYVDFALKQTGMNDMSNIPDINREAQMLLTGLLIMADWIASNTELFPLLSLEEWEDERGEEERIEEGWNHFNFPEIWCPNKPFFSQEMFKREFGFMPNLIQMDVLKAISKVFNPGIYVIEAPMGCGKTEIALEASEILASKFDCTGIFFGLPTQATANGIFPRIVQWGERQSEGGYQSIQLVHSSSALNEVFSKISKGIPETFDGDLDGGLIVHGWFCGKKQSCLADFVVGTIDQLLMSGLKRKHVMLQHLGLAQKVVIIDEVHAYDAYMNCYLDRVLSWLGMYHVPVILLSATLSSERREDLIKAYLSEKKLGTVLPKNNEYPVITWTDDKEVFQQAITYNKQQKKVSIEKITEEKMLEEVEKAVKSGGCIGIILNTVKRVQDIAQKLKEKNMTNLLMYHAQYVLPDRIEKEKEILRHVGKESGKEERRGLIIIGSQVLEQSLDLDVDLLISDLCPMDLLLQRIGRLHRHRIHDEVRPVELKEAKCFILCAENELEEGARTIYGDWLLKTTRKMLPDSLILPDDISKLVEKVYAYKDEENQCYQDYHIKISDQKNRAKQFLLENAKNKKDIHGILKTCIHDVKAEASVRDGISSIEVLLMMKDAQGQISFLPWQNGGKHVSREDIANPFICKKIAEQKLRLPSILCNSWDIYKTIQAIEEHCRNEVIDWQNSYLLKGELVLFLNSDFQASINGYKLLYDQENGLSYRKEDD